MVEEPLRHHEGHRPPRRHPPPPELAPSRARSAGRACRPRPTRRGSPRSPPASPAGGRRRSPASRWRRGESLRVSTTSRLIRNPRSARRAERPGLADPAPAAPRARRSAAAGRPAPRRTSQPCGSRSAISRAVSGARLANSTASTIRSCSGSGGTAKAPSAKNPRAVSFMRVSSASPASDRSAGTAPSCRSSQPPGLHQLQRRGEARRRRRAPPRRLAPPTRPAARPPGCVQSIAVPSSPRIRSSACSMV